MGWGKSLLLRPEFSLRSSNPFACGPIIVKVFPVPEMGKKAKETIVRQSAEGKSQI